MVHGSTIEYIHCIKNCYPYVFFLRIFFLRQLFDCYPRSPRRVRRVRLRVKQATAKVIPAGRCTHALGGALERLAAPPRQQALRACELAQIGFASPSGWLCQAGMSRGRQSQVILPTSLPGRLFHSRETSLQTVVQYFTLQNLIHG